MQAANRYAWLAARMLFGLFFVASGFGVAYMVAAGGTGVRQRTPAAIAFNDALFATGFVYPTLIVVFLVGGAAILWRRTVPLGLVLLAAPIVVITLFHLLLDSNYAWGLLWGGWWTVLAWHHRRDFAGLWQAGD